MGGFQQDAYGENKLLEDYFLKISRYPLLSREEEVELARRIRNGDEDALNKLINSNLRFVVSRAKKYQNRGLSLADLISEGNLAMPKAAKRFDEERGYKFISYAVWWINQGIMKAIAEQCDTIRVNVGQRQRNRHINNIVRLYEQAHPGRSPSIEYLVEVSGETQETVIGYLNTHSSTASLDAETDTGDSMLEHLCSETESPVERVLAYDRSKLVGVLLERLRPREKEVVSRYFGLGQEKCETLEEIGTSLHLTRERIRQIRDEALQKLQPLARASGYAPDSFK